MIRKKALRYVVHYNYSKEPQNSMGNPLSPYIKGLRLPGPLSTYPLGFLIMIPYTRP